VRLRSTLTHSNDWLRIAACQGHRAADALFAELSRSPRRPACSPKRLAGAAPSPPRRSSSFWKTSRTPQSRVHAAYWRGGRGDLACCRKLATIPGHRRRCVAGRRAIRAADAAGTDLVAWLKAFAGNSVALALAEDSDFYALDLSGPLALIA